MGLDGSAVMQSLSGFSRTEHFSRANEERFSARNPYVNVKPRWADGQLTGVCASQRYSAVLF